MKNLYLILTLVFLGSNLYSQFQDRSWIFGRPASGSGNATLYFGDLSNPVTTLPSGQTGNVTPGNGKEQWAVVADPATGDLIFYTDGKNVFDNQNNLVSETDLGANVSCSQPVMVAPIRHTETKSAVVEYFIFSNATGADSYTADIGPVTYTLYDAVSKTFGPRNSLPGPYGTADVTEGMKIIPCDSDPDLLWLVVSLYPHPGKETKYVVYRIYKNTITFQGDFDFGPQKQPVPPLNASPILYITYSNAGIATGTTNVGFSLQYSSAVFTCRFDNLTGQFLTNTVRQCLPGFNWTIPSIYNAEFSPNGNFLYYTAYKTAGDLNELYQVDLQEPVLTPVLVNTFSYTYAGGLKLGPDGFIYHIYNNGYFDDELRLGRILQPDVKFIPGVTPLGQFYQENFKTYYGVQGTGLCEFLVSPEIRVGNPDKTPAVIVYPNPASDKITISDPGNSFTGYDISIMNIRGQIVYREKVNQKITPAINVAGLDNGIYFLTLQKESRMCKSKFVIQR